MEIKYIFQSLTKKYKVILLGALCGALCGILYFLFPGEYKAQGSFYISKEPQISKDGSFSYEGYYSQQVAISSSKTFSALIESPDVGARVLEKLQKKPSDENLRKYRRVVNAINTGPQLITLVTKGRTQESAWLLWKYVAETLDDTNVVASLNLQRVVKEPIVTEPYKNIVVFSILGSIIGASFVLVIISTTEYFKE